MTCVQTALGASSRWTATVFSPLLLTVLSKPFAECAQPPEEPLTQEVILFMGLAIAARVGLRSLPSVTLPLVLAVSLCLNGIIIDLGGNRRLLLF